MIASNVSSSEDGDGVEHIFAMVEYNAGFEAIGLRAVLDKVEMYCFV